MLAILILAFAGGLHGSMPIFDTAL